jgi:hypothetical protein
VGLRPTFENCTRAIGNNLLGRYEVYFDTAKRIVHLY